MPDYTPNYNLEQPFQEEYYNVDVQNQNMEKIDAALAKKAELGADGKIKPEQIPDGIAGIPDGGAEGQVLTKLSAGDGDASWRTPVGKYMDGQTVLIHAQGETAVAGEDAIVFGDFRDRKMLSKYTALEGSAAVGSQSAAFGYACSALGIHSFAVGRHCTAKGSCSFAEGYMCYTGNSNSHAGGSCTEVTDGINSFAYGFSLKISKSLQCAFGQCNIESTSDNDRMIIGNGSRMSGNQYDANCFRVTDTGVYASGNYNASGADYAELFEWADRNPDGEDRAGRFVTLEGEKIRLATPEDDYIIGIVSGNPSVVGDVYDDQWQGLYLSDVFGRPIWEDVEEPDLIGPNGEVLRPAHVKHRQKVNPAYNSEEKYIPRSQRPEWDAVGLLGKLVAVDDGTCKINGWCTVGTDGMAVHSETRTKYRVMARLDESHIRILVL